MGLIKENGYLEIEICQFNEIRNVIKTYLKQFPSWPKFNIQNKNSKKDSCRILSNTNFTKHQIDFWLGNRKSTLI
jgi:hypothetical protein